MKAIPMSMVGILLFLTACGGVKKVQEPIYITKTETIKEVVHDTVFKIEKQTSQAVYSIDCPEPGSKPVLKSLSKSSSKDMDTPKVVLKDHTLVVDCESKAQELFLQWKERYVTTHSLEQKPIYIEHPLKWWQKALMWVGGLAILAIILDIPLKIKK